MIEIQGDKFSSVGNTGGSAADSNFRKKPTQLKKKKCQVKTKCNGAHLMVWG
jgi:hypothetical protein